MCVTVDQCLDYLRYITLISTSNKFETKYEMKAKLFYIVIPNSRFVNWKRIKLLFIFGILFLWSMVRNIWGVFPLVPSKREKNILVLLSLYVYLLREVCLLFNFIIQKLKSKHTSLKKYTNRAKLIYFSLVLREREEKKTPNISHLKSLSSSRFLLFFQPGCSFHTPTKVFLQGINPNFEVALIPPG